MAGEPLLAKWVKDDNSLPPVCALYDIEQLSLAKSVELPWPKRTTRASRGMTPVSLPKQATLVVLLLTFPPWKVTKPCPVASLPTSITSVLPCPLGKMAVLPAVHTQQWFDDCLLDNPQFVELTKQAQTVLFKQHNLVHHITNKCKQQHHKHEANTDAFIVEAMLPP